MATHMENAGLPGQRPLRRMFLELAQGNDQVYSIANAAAMVADALSLTAEQREYVPDGWSRPYVEFAAGQTMNDFKWIGVMEQPRQGQYRLTDEGRSVTPEEVEERHKARTVRLRRERQARRQAVDTDEDEVEEELAEDEDWRTTLLNLLKQMTPQAFERLAGRLLEIAGFDDVEVTGRSSDGGIDGIGVYRPTGLISFHTAFQCKRYQGSVSASTIRDFRGSFVGRSDRGIVITTGTFTSEAEREASRAGAQPIDLVNGESLCDLLKQYEMGVEKEMVEKVTVDIDYFAQFEDSS